MKNSLLAFFFLLSMHTLQAQEVVHYWHFNTVTTTVDSVVADFSVEAQAPWLYYQAAYPNVDPANLGYMDDVSGTELNIRMGEVDGEGIRPRNPSDSMELYIQLPTTAYDSIQFSYATHRSGSGMLKQVLSYTTDGQTYQEHPDTVLVTEDWELVSFDFAAITGVSNNPNFAVKIRFYEQNTGGSGNNRIDNMVLEGNSLSNQVTAVLISPDSASLLVTETLQLNATVIPASATNQAVSWSSTQPSVATVDTNGLVTALTSGFTEIIVTTIDGGYTDTCELSVLSPAMLSFEVKSAETGNALSNAWIILNNDTTYTDTDGMASVELMAGLYNYTVEANGYFSTSDNVELTADTSIVVELIEKTAVVHYWHFNNLTPDANVTDAPANYTLLPNNTPVISYLGEGNGYMDDYEPGSMQNAQFGEAEGFALRVRNPSFDRALYIPLPSTDCENIRLSFDVHRSGSGMLQNVLEYTLDGGTSFQQTGMTPDTIDVTEDYVTHIISFTEVAGANNNPDFGVRITWIGNTQQDNGNNRYDNLTMMAATNLNNSLIQEEVTVKVFPNPSKGSFRFENLPANSQVKLINSMGQIILQGNAAMNSSQWEFPADTQNGLYFILIETQHQVSSHAILLQR